MNGRVCIYNMYLTYDLFGYRTKLPEEKQIGGTDAVTDLVNTERTATRPSKTPQCLHILGARSRIRSGHSFRFSRVLCVRIAMIKIHVLKRSKVSILYTQYFYYLFFFFIEREYNVIREIRLTNRSI